MGSPRKSQDVRIAEVAAILHLCFDNKVENLSGFCASMILEAYQLLLPKPIQTSKGLNLILHAMDEQGLIAWDKHAKKTFSIRLHHSKMGGEAWTSAKRTIRKNLALQQKVAESRQTNIVVKDLVLPEEEPVDAPVQETGPSPEAIAAALLTQVMELLKGGGPVPDEELLKRLGEQTAITERLRDREIKLTARCDDLEAKIHELETRNRVLKQRAEVSELNVQKLARDRVVIDETSRKELDKIIRSTPQTRG